MSSDFLLIYGKTWHSIYNALKRTEMNLQEAAVWMPQTGSPDASDWQSFLGEVEAGKNPSQGQAGLGMCLPLLPRGPRPFLACDRVGPGGSEGNGRQDQVSVRCPSEVSVSWGVT